MSSTSIPTLRAQAARLLAPIGAVCALAVMAGCATNPQTPTPMPAPVVVAPMPRTEAQMGPASASFVFLQTPSNNSTNAEPSSSGVGTLYYEGKHYGFTASGVTADRIGGLPGPITSEVYHLAHLRDINGTYTAVVMSGGKEAILKNPQGVTIHMLANSGIDMTLQTATVKLNYR